MGFERDASFYDNRLFNETTDLYKFVKFPVYEKAANMLPSNSNDPYVVDLGCGSGKFGRLLADKGYNKYIGYDFSTERIKIAREYVTEFKFVVKNIFNVDKTVFGPDTVFVLLEILEHINDDIKLLKSLPSGNRVIFSVPNYDSKTHVRYFDSMEDVVNRYSMYVKIGDTKVIQFTQRETIYLCKGCKK